VLLVEDEAMVSVYMVELLTSWGLEVVAQHDPRAAADLLASPEPFDMLLTDQTMPGMTGLALCAFAKSQRPTLPVLVYTGDTSEIGSAELDCCGARALLRKPIDAAQLRGLVYEVLSLRGRVA
jgi:CheY-like chemotaxis protein